MGVMLVDGGIFSEIFSATKQSVNTKYYFMIFSIADETELNMEIARLQVRIDQLVRGMLDEGLLHDQFLKSQELQAAGYTPLVGIMIHQYCTEMENYLTEFANYLYFPIWIQPKVDYTKMSGRAFGLQLCSFNAGVRCIGHACSLLFQACTRRSKEQCVEVLYKLYREYSRLRTKFMAVLQLEVQIFRLRKDS